MNKKVDIFKSAGVLIKDRKFLVTRSKSKDFFIAPGGKVEPTETPVQALVRELMEELNIQVSPDKLRYLGTFYAEAAEQVDKLLQMEVYLVEEWSGRIWIGNEVEEFRWINSEIAKNIELGSVFKHDILPLLKQQNLID